jgi:formate dehydrogenase maturation protein FdhE
VSADPKRSPKKSPLFQRGRSSAWATRYPTRTSSETHPTVRIEACETCRRYVKSIDLTADARAVPEVDDLVSLGMDLWAQEQGYARVAPGLAGI